MNAQNWDDILRLLSMMIIGSRESQRKEVDLFEKVALTLRNEIYPELNLTSEMAKNWIVHNREELTRDMSSLYFDKTLNTLLNNLKVLPDKKPIILTMIKMTISQNGERSKNENSVIGGMNDAWGNPKPIAMMG